MYKLIIVDDEEEIREGLSELIDWNRLGFVVEKQFNDGSDAIRYLQDHHIDSVLTDIKMTYASGIDLAKYVYENRPDIKVVFLSGFQEFTLAREAIRFHVAHYLLKPTNLDEVANVFLKIKSELDERADKREIELRQSRDINSLRPLMMEQFFLNLLSGAPWGRNLDELRGRLRQSGLSIDPLKGRVSELKAKWSMAQHALNHNVERHTISLAITKEKDNIYFTCVHMEENKIVIIGNARVMMSEQDFLKKTEQFFTYIQSTLLSLLGVSIRLESINIYEGLPVLLNKYYEQHTQITAQDDSNIQATQVLNVEHATSELADEANLDTVNQVVKEKDRITIREAKKYIMDHFEVDLTLSDVANHVGLNPVYFSRLFKLETNMNYSDYVVSVRIEKAMEYLKNPTYRVYEIGYMVGYKNTKHFHKVFKQNTNLTPSEYRGQL